MSDKGSAVETQRGVLHMEGWGGTSYQLVEVIGETKTRYRIRAVQRTKLAGRSRWIDSGTEALVPKRAVRLETDILKDE